MQSPADRVAELRRTRDDLLSKMLSKEHCQAVADKCYQENNFDPEADHTDEEIAVEDANR
ncbi:hypothetical protein FB45DRAFT_1037895 [Roridomyces roridus]|uniref:Uncharacterized protein n=1 Tax=Roridomyces roridus TaxID=1738132 RepID=A0AAD7F9U2_9AGAR|nr:hypothetical protein FB45DRAFT_1037895 [Roridomyces roridus]